MEAKTNYFAVGLAVLILFAGLLIASLWLSTGFNQKTYHPYLVFVNEAVSGLTLESPVKYNGVKVGFISKITLNPHNPQFVNLLIQIEEGTPVTTSTEASLVMQGITGTTYLGLSASSSSLTPLEKIAGEPLPVIPYKASFFNQLEKNINHVTEVINHFLDKENAQLVKKTLQNLQKISSMIEHNDKNISKTLTEFPLLLNEFKLSIREFKTMSKNLASAGTQLSTTMVAGKNSIDKISQEAIPPAVLLLRRLDLISANLEKTSAQLRQNPAVLIRGSAPPKPGPGE